MVERWDDGNAQKNVIDINDGDPIVNRTSSFTAPNSLKVIVSIRSTMLRYVTNIEKNRKQHSIRITKFINTNLWILLGLLLKIYFLFQYCYRSYAVMVLSISSSVKFTLFQKFFSRHFSVQISTNSISEMYIYDFGLTRPQQSSGSNTQERPTGEETIYARSNKTFQKKKLGVVFLFFFTS